MYVTTAEKILSLSPDVNVKKMDKSYESDYSNTVTLNKYKQVFLLCSNLRRKRLKKDTCNNCDTEIKFARHRTVKL
jgi:hypothetical protein